MELFKMAKEAMSMRSKVKEMEKALKSKIVDITVRLYIVCPKSTYPNAFFGQINSLSQ